MVIAPTQFVSGPTISPECRARAGYGVHPVDSIAKSFDAATAEAVYNAIAGGKGLVPRGDGDFAFFDTEKGLGALYELYAVPSQ
jgi:hypothetical protein